VLVGNNYNDDDHNRASCGGAHHVISFNVGSAAHHRSATDDGSATDHPAAVDERADRRSPGQDG
jgi:hypothetical protein